MVDLSKLKIGIERIARTVKETVPLTHASTALLRTAHLDNMLTTVLEAHMPNNSNRMKERLFGGYGPLSTFSAKIDVAFAFGFIPGDARRMLHAIKEIRNAFAHAHESSLHFDHEIIIQLMAKLPPKKQETTMNLNHFVEMCLECLELLSAHMDRQIALMVSSASTPRSG